MHKKVIALLATIALLFAAAPAANATGSLTQTDKFSLDNSVNSRSLKLVQVTDTLKVALWQEIDGNGLIYKSGVVSADGQLSQISQFGSSSNIDFEPNFVLALGPNHLMAVAYKYSIDNGNNSFTTNVRVVFTDDGVNWSAPISALTDATQTFCDPFMGCGYDVQNIIFDSLGHIILLATLQSDFHGATLMATSSSDGVVWANATSLKYNPDSMSWNPMFNSGHVIELAATASGAVATFSLYNAVDGSTQIWSARMPDSTHPFWLSATVAYSAPASTSVYARNLLSTSKGDVVETFWEQGSGSPALKTMIWSQTTKSWSTPVVLHAATSENITSYYLAKGQGKLAVLVWVEYSNGQDDQVKSLVFTDGVAGNVSTMRAAVGDGTANDQVTGLSVSPDSTVSAVIWNYNIRKALLLEQQPGGTTTTTELPIDLSYNYASKIAEDSLGNLTILSLWVPDSGSGNDLVVYQKTRASAPSAAAKPTIAGKAKIKGKLTASTVKFSSISGSGAVAYQWYSCTKLVKKSPNSVPKTCKPIKGATKAKYVVGKTDAKKFLLVSTSSANSLGLTTVFSASTAVVK